MNDQEKIVILEKNMSFKFKDITDFDITKCVTEYVEKGGWNENKSQTQAIADCASWMIQKLARKR